MPSGQIREQDRKVERLVGVEIVHEAEGRP